MKYVAGLYFSLHFTVLKEVLGEERTRTCVLMYWVGHSTLFQVSGLYFSKNFTPSSLGKKKKPEYQRQMKGVQGVHLLNLSSEQGQEPQAAIGMKCELFMEKHRGAPCQRKYYPSPVTEVWT